jgi:DNA-binding LacI/PurR family transcriptional regulator
MVTLPTGPRAAAGNLDPRLAPRHGPRGSIIIGTVQSAPRPVTLKELAARAGVSATTVSHSLSGKGRVDPETRARIRDLAQLMGYTPNPAARTLRTGHSHSIALVTSVSATDTGLEEEVNYFTNLAVKAAHEALSSGYALVLLPPLDQGTWLDTVSVDGAIVVFPKAEDWLLETAERRSLPLVTVGSDTHRSHIPGVVEDSEAIADLAFGHLAERGCRRQALLLSPAVFGLDANMRAAYTRWTAQRGIEAQIFEAPPGGAEQAGYELARTLLDRPPAFDGILAPLDAMAAGFARGARSMGLHLPADLKIVTTEGNWARHGEMPITAVDFHPELLVRQAVQLLIARLEGRPAPDLRAPVPSLIVRSTT